MEPSDVLLCPAMPPTTDTPLPLLMFREPIRDRQVDNICSCYPERPPACSRRAGGLSPVIPTRPAGVGTMGRRGPQGTVPVQRATKWDGLVPRGTLGGRVARGTGISAPRPEIPARSWRTAGSPYYFSAPGWGKCSRTPASRNTGGAPGGFYDQARAWRLERRDFAQRSTYFEVKAGRGGKRAPAARGQISPQATD